LSSTKVPLRDPDGKIVGVAGVDRDITGRKSAEALLEGQVQLLELCAAGASLEDVLENLVHLVECQATGIFGAILLVDDDGAHLRVGAAPSLAPEFANVVGTINIAHISTSCGAALYRREFVVSSDMSSDPLWEEYRDLAAEHGYRSCWSMPIFSSDDAILATFAMYSMTPREPSPSEIGLAEVTGRIARALIELKRATWATPKVDPVKSTGVASAPKTNKGHESRPFNIVGSTRR
jgi:GAF domain-containing protein